MLIALNAKIVVLSAMIRTNVRVMIRIRTVRISKESSCSMVILKIKKNKAMTTVEELQSMTHEDLVRRVQELEQDLKEVKEQSDMWLDSFTRLQARHESSINALDNIVKLAKLK